MVQTKNVRLLLEIEDGLPAQIMIDPLRLRQILFNLLSNAVKFTSKGLIIMRVYRIPNDQGVMELPVTPLPDLRFGVVASHHPLFHH